MEETDSSSGAVGRTIKMFLRSRVQIQPQMALQRNLRKNVSYVKKHASLKPAQNTTYILIVSAALHKYYTRAKVLDIEKPH